MGVDVESSLNYWTKSAQARRTLRERPRKRLVRSFFCLFPIACPTFPSSASRLSDKSRKWAGADTPIPRRERTISAQAIILMSISSPVFRRCLKILRQIKRRYGEISTAQAFVIIVTTRSENLRGVIIIFFAKQKILWDTSWRILVLRQRENRIIIKFEVFGFMWPIYTFIAKYIFLKSRSKRFNDRPNNFNRF